MVKQQPRNKPRFSGSFFTWRVNLNTDREKGISRNLLVYSSGSRVAVLNFLWHKFLWNELTRLEFELFLMTLTGSEGDERKWALLSVLHSDLSKKVARKRLLKLEEIYGFKPSTREQYLGLKGMRIEIQRESRRLQKSPKYSGYVRSISSIGRGKKNSLSEVLNDVVSPNVCYEEEKVDWVNLLHVGAITLFSNAGEISLFHPDESQTGRNVERVPKRY